MIELNLNVSRKRSGTTYRNLDCWTGGQGDDGCPGAAACYAARVTAADYAHPHKSVFAYENPFVYVYQIGLISNELARMWKPGREPPRCR